jgi:hypothetical protein
MDNELLMQRLRRGLRDHDELGVIVAALLNAYEQTEREDEIDLEEQKVRVREGLARYGYRLMHRRKGQYWLLHSTPRTLDQIESWLENTNREGEVH